MALQKKKSPRTCSLTAVVLTAIVVALLCLGATVPFIVVYKHQVEEYERLVGGDELLAATREWEDLGVPMRQAVWDNKPIIEYAVATQLSPWLKWLLVGPAAANDQTALPPAIVNGLATAWPGVVAFIRSKVGPQAQLPPAPTTKGQMVSLVRALLRPFLPAGITGGW